jgi:lipid-binding SYLF domain-containing protein
MDSLQRSLSSKLLNNKKKEVTIMRYFYLTIILLLAFTGSTFVYANSAGAASAAEIDRDVKSALENLYGKSASAKALGAKAKSILVFPSIVKGGFIVGGQYGEGALLKGGKTSGYYNTVQLSYGLQAGLQKHGYALFFMTESAMKWLDKSDGWEVGVGPSIVVVDVGAATSKSTTTLQSDIYAFFFDQKGLMGGLGLQGTKITKIEK